MVRHWTSHVIVAAWVWGAATSAAYALEPGDIAVVFNTKSPTSLAVARFYVNARKIPMNHLVGITCDAGEHISEADYRTKVVPELLKNLGDRKLLPDEKAGIPGIKCLVTTYDVPLQIQAYAPSPADAQEIAGLSKELEAISLDLQSRIARYDTIAPSPATATARAAATAGAPATATATAPAKLTWQQVLPQVQAAATAAARRMQALPPEQRATAVDNFMLIQEHVGGPAAVLRAITVPPDAPNADVARQHLADMAAQLKADQEQYQSLAPKRNQPVVRRQLITLREKAEGVIGEAQAIEETLAFLKPDQSSSCFDNELALILAEPGYPRANWVTNPKCLDNYRIYKQPGVGAPPPVLMVCRIDGATQQLAEDLVTRAIEVEAKGLEGKLYLDARGLRGTDAYAQFDVDLRRTAEWMKAHSTMETVLEDTDALLEAKNAPDAALYCGWYSLDNYHESGQWVKGAVGYHVASLEMMTLRNRADRGWVRYLLEHGFAGTLGAVEEPYLHSFPKPSQFFPLLLSGEFTQGEVWEVTCPLLSWRQGFVGDPLYHPFKAKPRVKVEDLKADPVLKGAWEILGR